MESDFYLEFENKFRGSREQVHDILSNYNGLIQHIIEIDEKPTLLDIGCGRGEWLQKCSDKGFKSTGIEINNAMVETCHNFGLEIIKGDALDILKDLPDNCFSLITAFHIIEHISFDSIQNILVECNRVLKKEGLLILETPSIDNLSISSQNFYIDPTHINPINPDLLSFMLGRVGFDMVKVFYINGGPLQNKDKYSITRILNGVAQDLMLLASKSNEGSFKLNENESWTQSLKIGSTTIEACVDFDHLLRTNLYRNEELINTLRARIYTLEKKLDTFSSSYLFKIFISGFNKLKTIFSKVFIFRRFISNSLCKILSFFAMKVFQILNIFLSKRSKYLYLYCKYMNKCLEIFGYRIKNGKLFKKTLKHKEEKNLIYSHEQKLDLHFDLSSKAKRLYEDFK